GSKQTEAQQIAQFLKEMLQGAGPEVAKGRDASILVQILNNTADRVSKELTNQPTVEADLLNTIGNLYDDLGQYEKAEPILRRALEIQRRLNPNGSAAVADALKGVARAVDLQNKLTEADAVLRELLVMLRKLKGNNDP